MGLKSGQAYDAVEAFAGVGNLSACLRAAGMTAASLEILDWSTWLDKRMQLYPRRPLCKGNPLDLLSPAGMA